MRKHYILIFLLSFLYSCNSNSFKIQGEITELNSDTIYIIHDDPTSKIDTLTVKDKKFNYEIELDTTTLMRLFWGEKNYLPIIATKPGEMKITGRPGEFTIEGKGDFMDIQHFTDSIAKKFEGEELLIETEKYIRAHTQSYLSSYLIDLYFIQKNHPDYEKANQLIEAISGTLRDCRILNVIQEEVENNKKKDKYLSYFTCKDRNNKYLSLITKDKYTLVNFWASWDKESKEWHDSLYAQLPNIPDKKLYVINISLDNDRNTWLDACLPDTTEWKESCELKSWNSSAVQQNHINRLPENILIDRNRKILRKNIIPKDIPAVIKQLIEEEKAKTNKKK